MAGMDVEADTVVSDPGPPEDATEDTILEDKGSEDMKEVEERKDGEEKKDSEEKINGEGYGTRREEIGERKDEMQTEDVGMVEAEDAEGEEISDKGVREEEEDDNSGKENDVNEEKDSVNGEKEVDESKEAVVSKKKSIRGRKVGEKGDTSVKNESVPEAKESPRTPATSSMERPVRERKTVERLVQIIQKEPNKEFLIDKGRGTPLKDIPNVAYKLAKKKSADLKLLHQTLFGRRGKVVNFKSHILQFSGFVWHGDDEKQKAKVKEKLDKYIKDTLLEICDLFDIPVSRATTRKEDLVAKLLDFMVAPHATTDVILAEMDQQPSKSRKRKRVSKGTTSRSTGGMSEKSSRKKRAKSEGTPNTKSQRAEETENDEVEEDENDNENGLSDEDEPDKHSDTDEKENELEEADEDDDAHLKKGKQDTKRSSTQRDSARKVKMGTTAKSPSKSPSSKQDAKKSNDADAKVFSRKKKHIDPPKLKSTPKPAKKEKVAGKRVSTGKGKAEEVKQSGPSKEELRKTICEILKEVDFNTATFTDILKKLAMHYKMDLTPRKSAIKLIIQEELTRLADEAEEDEDEDDDETEENPKSTVSTSKELEA